MQPSQPAPQLPIQLQFRLSVLMLLEAMVLTDEKNPATLERFDKAMGRLSAITGERAAWQIVEALTVVGDALEGAVMCRVALIEPIAVQAA